MATGSGPLAANVDDGGVSTLTPTYAVPNMAGLYEEQGKALARLAAPVQDALDARAARAGQKAGEDAAAKIKAGADAKAAYNPAAGDPAADVADQAGIQSAKQPRPLSDAFTHGAYTNAFNTATLSRLKDDIDNHNETLKGQYQYDPQGYKDAADKVLSGYIQGAPEHMAVAVESYGKTKFDDGYATLSRVAQERATTEANQAIGVRVKALNEKLLGLASAGSIESTQFDRADQERALLQQEREKNPAILYSGVQRQEDDDSLYESLHGAAAARAGALAYGEAGGGLPGKAAAYRVLNDQVLNGEALKDIDPGRRHRIYLDAKKQIDDYTQADIQMQRDQDAQARADRQEQRDRVGALRLDVQLGGVTEKQINARDDIPDADKASLISSVRAVARRDAAEARATAAAERAGAVEHYREFSDGAHAGTLSDADIADGVHAGLIKPGQARVLAAMRDKGLKPIIDDVMAPVHDAAKKPGRRISAEKLAIAEDQATQFARANVGATLPDKLAAGEAIAKRVFGAKSTPGPAAGGSSADLAGRVAKLKSDFNAGHINRATMNNGIKALLNGN
jgi:hypothetical protein